MKIYVALFRQKVEERDVFHTGLLAVNEAKMDIGHAPYWDLPNGVPMIAGDVAIGGWLACIKKPDISDTDKAAKPATFSGDQLHQIRGQVDGKTPLYAVANITLLQDGYATLADHNVVMTLYVGRFYNNDMGPFVDMLIDQDIWTSMLSYYDGAPHSKLLQTEWVLSGTLVNRAFSGWNNGTSGSFHGTVFKSKKPFPKASDLSIQLLLAAMDAIGPNYALAHAACFKDAAHMQQKLRGYRRPSRYHNKRTTVPSYGKE